MRLMVTKLGKIEAAEVDLRPLTVLVGPNHTNKSWVAFAAQHLLTWPASTSRNGGWDFQLDGELLTTVQSAFAEVSRGSSAATVSVSRGTSDDRMGAMLGRGDLSVALGVPESALPSEASVVLELEQADRDRHLYSGVDLHIERTGNFFQLQARFRRADGGRDLVETAAVESAHPSGYMSVIDRWLRVMHGSLVARTIALPVARQAMLAYGLRSPDQGPRPLLPGYIRSFTQLVEQLRLQGVQADEGPLGDAHALLDRGALGGTVVPGALGSMSFQPAGSRLRLPLSASASGAQSLAALSLYLRSLAQPGDFIVIDEPELCLHPQAQIALVEVFAILVRRGMRVLYTTHSPYMVDHLNNLMELSRLPLKKRKTVAKRFQLGTAEAWLDPEEVAVHEFGSSKGKVEVKSVLDRDQAMIDTDTFGRWSDQLGSLYNSLLDAEE